MGIEEESVESGDMAVLKHLCQSYGLGDLLEAAGKAKSLTSGCGAGSCKDDCTFLCSECYKCPPDCTISR